MIDGRLRSGIVVATVLMAWTLAGSLRSSVPQAVDWLQIAAVPAPAGPGSGEPQLTVSDRGVLLSWIEHEGTSATLRFAERTEDGWSDPRTVAAGGDWSVNPVEVPSVLRLSNGSLAAQWLQKSGPGMHANDIRLAYSTDDGRTWAPAFTAHRDSSHNQRGLVSTLFEQPGGGIGLIWLEGQPMQTNTRDAGSASAHPAGAAHAHQQGAAGHQRPGGHTGMAAMADMSLRFAAFDAGWIPIVEMTIDARVCECCPTAAAVTAEGLVVAYRDRSDDEIRDIYVARLEDGQWREPAAVHADNWQIAACPINGPALSASGRQIAVAWFTVEDGQGQAWLAFSQDAGRQFGSPVRLDDGASLGRVDVEMLPDGSAVATWIERVDVGAAFRVRRLGADGTRSAPVTIASVGASRTSGIPRVARHGGELVFTWTESDAGTSRVRTAVASLPARVNR